MLDLTGKVWDKLASADPKRWDLLCAYIERLEKGVEAERAYGDAANLDAGEAEQKLAAARREITRLEKRKS